MRAILPSLASLSLVCMGCAPAAPAPTTPAPSEAAAHDHHGHDHGHGHGHGHGHAHGPATTPAPAADQPGHQGQGFHHGFSGAEGWAKVFDSPERDAWQKPEAVIDLLALTPTSKVADVGAGTGYFAVRIARRVPSGRVYAVDVEPDMVRHLGERASREGLAQIITPIQGTADDAKLPEPVDVVLIVDTLHHIDARPAYLTKLRDKLKEGGRLFVVDFKLDAPMGPPKEHRLAPADVIKDAERAGLRPFPVALDLPNQYVLGFKR